MEQRVKISSTRNQREVFTAKEKFVLVKKGRRFGLTRGASNYFIRWLISGVSPLLWVDTINGNIDRYFDRYFYPVLKENNIEFDFNRQKRQLTINGNYADFRSADRPESIEGFGYKKIFLNEAGIILKSDYLYTNAILPMLIDFPDSQIFIGGAPKGMYKKDGTEHRFYNLVKNAHEKDNYKLFTFSSYDNPTLSKEDIKLLELEIGAMSEKDVLQEIYGEFVDKAGNNPFIHSYDPKKCESITTTFDPNKAIYIGMDFNLNPFGFIFAHIWRDSKGEHIHVFDEATIDNANLDSGIDYIRRHYGRHLHNIKLTGDAMGKRRDFGQKDHASYYHRIEKELGLRPTQLTLPPNPTHENSRDDCNYVIAYADVKINPDKAPNTARDLRTVQCDAFGSILKKNRNDLTQRADHLDCFRYLVNGFLFEWVKKHQRGQYK